MTTATPDVPVPDPILANVSIDALVPSAMNPRGANSAAADEALLESVRHSGVRVPLLVRPLEPARDGYSDETSYEILDGHRRYAAAVELGLPSLPVRVQPTDDADVVAIAVEVNTQREGLSPLDEAESFDRLLLHPGVTVTEVAAKVGQSPAYVGRRLKLLRCVQGVRDALREGRLDVARAELLAKLSPSVQEQALGEAVWNPGLSMMSADGEDEGQGRVFETLEPLSELREWVNAHLVITLDDLRHDSETRELFPAAAEALDTSLAAGGGGQGDRDVSSGLLTVALDRFDQSPSKRSIPDGVLRLGKDFRIVTGRKCASAQPAVVTFGDRKGDVVTVCTAKKRCETHWPTAASTKAKATSTTSDGKRHAAPRRSWEEEEAERQRQQKIFESVVPALKKAIAEATVKVETTDALLLAILRDRFSGSNFKDVLNLVGRVSVKTFGRAWTVAEAFNRLWTERSAAEAITIAKAKFDLPKAMKDAESAMAAQTASAAKPATPKSAKANSEKSKPAKAKPGRVSTRATTKKRRAA